MGSGIKYLGLRLYGKWSFERHFEGLALRVARAAASLGRLMPNLGPNVGARRLYAGALQATVLYGAPVWAGRVVKWQGGSRCLRGALRDSVVWVAFFAFSSSVMLRKGKRRGPGLGMVCGLVRPKEEAEREGWIPPSVQQGEAVGIGVFPGAHRVGLVIDQKRLELANRRGAVFHQDNARPHMSIATRQKLRELGWEWTVLRHPPYSPAPSDYHVFLALQNFLSDKKLTSREICGNRLLEFFANRNQDFYERSIMKIPLKWQQIINPNGA
ncbi:PREDICTED: uncharacterized protein LOC106750469, partial [Dinoponera quadriceps]|uniref:Uncharacterized protein LOC106750469 n=1 Tax=Dinoponera quadriceps TaxID=609295 RepID=A0A6P3Y627_DINQU